MKEIGLNMKEPDFNRKMLFKIMKETDKNMKEPDFSKKK